MTPYHQKQAAMADASVSHDIVQARRTARCSDDLLRAQLRTGQHFLSPDAVAAAWGRLNASTATRKRT